MIELNDIIYAKTLRDLRIKSRKIQFEVAQELGLRDQRLLSEYESGKRHFTDSFIQKICAFFKITEEQFKKNTRPASNNKFVDPDVSSVKIDKPETIHENIEIKLLFYRKNIIELQLEKTRLESQLCEAEYKIKSLLPNQKLKNIYVII